MAYPKNDTDFQEGTVTSVTVVGDRIMVDHHMPNLGLSGGYDGSESFPKPDFEVRPGMTFRYYSFMSMGQRGVYIAGRVVVPYADQETHTKRMLAFSKTMLMADLERKPKSPHTKTTS